jgi:hypothetical protein
MEGRGPAAGIPRRPGLGRQARGHRFGFVLLLLLGYACFQVAAPDDAWARFVTILLGAAILLAAVWATGAQRLVGRAAVAAAVLVAATAAVYLAVTGSVPLLLGAIANGLLVAIAPAIIAEGSCATCVRSRGSRFTRSPACSRSTCWRGCSSLPSLPR